MDGKTFHEKVLNTLNNTDDSDISWLACGTTVDQRLHVAAARCYAGGADNAFARVFVTKNNEDPDSPLSHTTHRVDPLETDTFVYRLKTPEGVLERLPDGSATFDTVPVGPLLGALVIEHA